MQVYRVPKIVKTNPRRWHRMTRRQRQTGRDAISCGGGDAVLREITLTSCSLWVGADKRVVGGCVDSSAERTA